MVTVAVQLTCADASHGAEFKCLDGQYLTMTVKPNTDPVDRHSNQAHISFSSAINLEGPCHQRDNVDNSYLDIEARVSIMLKLRGFICPWASHDSHKAGYELLPTTCCYISRMSNSVIERVKLLIRLTSRPPTTVDVAQVHCGPLQMATMLSDAHQLIPIYVNDNLVTRHRVWISEFVKTITDFKAEVVLHYPECVPSIVIGIATSPGVWVTTVSGRLLSLFSVDGIGRQYLDPTEASLIPSAIPCSL